MNTNNTDGAVRTVGQLRYAVVDAVAPLATGLAFAQIFGGVAAGVTAGVVVAGLRMVPYVGEAWQSRRTRP